ACCVPSSASLSSRSLHDALPISCSCCTATSAGATCSSRSTAFTADGSRAFILRAARRPFGPLAPSNGGNRAKRRSRLRERIPDRSEEHTSELQSRENLVCRLLLE